MALKVGFVNDSGYIKPCGFHKPPCARPGPFLELVFFLVDHLLVENSSISHQIEVVPMDRYTISGSQSLMGSLVLNETDTTPPYMLLSEERSKVLPYVFPMYEKERRVGWKTLEDALGSGPQAFSIHQMQSAFWLLGMAALGVFCVTFFECLKKRKGGRKKTVAPQQVNL